MVTSAIAIATAASANQIATQRSESSGGPEMIAATIAVIPISTPPQPGTAVKAEARDIASRMKRMLSIAWAWIGSGSARIEDFIAQRADRAGGGGRAGRAGGAGGARTSGEPPMTCFAHWLVEVSDADFTTIDRCRDPGRRPVHARPVSADRAAGG